ncbi:MAG: tyrosine-type recombinase/integrase [Phycisphaerae bacterium]|nr:tyrosine-type recombinase/integrase [Phycisphaerae bacterium]
MFEYYFTRPRVRVRMRANVLFPEIRKLIDYLHDCGYRAETIQSYAQKIEHFGNWLKTHRIQVRFVNKDTITSFLNEHLPNCHCTRLRSCNQINVRAALNRLLYVLPSGSQKPKDLSVKPIDKEIQKFKAYMTDVCGLSASTVHYRARYATEFLMNRFGKRQVKHQDITPRHIIKYVANKATQYKSGSTKVLACSLRCYFRFLQFNGTCSLNLISAVPTVPSWKLATLPKTMDQEQLSRFIASFNRKTPSGQRDYAIALCFLDLGMRASEVTNLLLDDIDWKNSTISIRASKTFSYRILPLPVHLGRALAGYLKNARPKTSSRNIFIRHSVPKGKPVTIYIVRAAMRYAHERAGLGDLFTGTHVFRHTLATAMHQKGASLKDVADILGHKCIDSTTIYTKLNLTMLAKVALPWPGVQS